jgi:hypothetical protein
MPDLDIVARSLTTPWRPAYRLMKGGHECLGPTTKDRPQQQLLTLYQDYCREWQTFPTPLADWSTSELRLSA